MGVLRLNGKAYGGGIDVIEVTQAQYNALPESKLSDDILYVISDSVNGSDGYPPLIYSTEEREIGVWTNGKPLYQKTVEFGTLPNSTVKSVAHGISNIDKIILVIGTIIRTSDNDTLTIPFVSATGVNNNIQCTVNLTNCNIRTGSDQTGRTAIFTIQYTKTTDTKGSGRWTTQGTLAQHYSTTERLIGTWVDGKPLYEKTIYLGALTQDSSWHSISHGISNMDNCVKVDGVVIATSGTEFYPIPLYRPTTQSGILVYADATSIYYMNNYYNQMDETYVTIQYTKTTD